MRINHNIASLNTYRQMGANTEASGKSLEKLSSGLRINRAGDDAAGLAISEKMRGQIRGLDQASRNAQDSISLIQTAEGALNETHSILQRMRELAVQASNDTSTDSDRSELQKEVSQLKSEVDRIASTTEFNSKKLLNGSLSSAKSAQGTVANSAKFDVADVAATGGTSQAGLTIAVSNAASGQNGTGYSVTAGAELAERTVIQAGVNNKFDININGNAITNVTIDASSSDGYTRQQFVEALNTAIKNAVKTAQNGAEKDQFNQVNVSLTSDNHVKITTAATGSSATLQVALTDTTVGANKSALESMGFQAKQTTVTGNVDLRSGYTVADANSQFKINIGEKSVDNISLITDGGLVDTQSYTFAELKTALQTALDKKLGSGVVTIGDDGNGNLKLTSNVGVGNLSIAAATAKDGSATLFNTSLTASDVPQSANVTTKGTNTVNEVKAGTVISKGANDQFNIKVDGGAEQTITLKAGNYANRADLVTEINNQINTNSNLVGKVKAQLANDNSGKIEFVSTATGSSSSVSVKDPTASSQSALGAIGYAGSAGAISGAALLEGGVDLTTAGDTKLTVTFGNKTATLDIKGYDGINTDNTAAAYNKTSRDAIVKALQSEFDKAFGEGAVTVNTSTAANGNDTLVLTTNARVSNFKIEDNGATGATKLFGADKTATVSAAGTNSETHGTDAVDNTLSNNTKLADLSDADGNKLGLSEGNVIKIAGTQNGKAFEASVTVKADSEVSDVLNAMRNLDAFKGSTVSLDATSGKIVVKGANGQDKDISNLNFSAQRSATDTTKVADFNKMFGSFNETQKAQNKASDTSLSMQIGANEGQTLNVDINDMGTSALRIQDVDVSTAKGAQTAISVINNALETVSAERSKLGAYQNRLEHTINNLGTSSENLTASESRIRDVDMAKEMMEFQKNNILSQAAQAMLAQANQQPQGVLQLLR